MVHKIINNRFRVFVESFLVAGIIFLLGFSVGFFVENYRTASVIEDYKSNEIEALDLKLQNYYYQIMNDASCDVAIEQNFIFADKIYEKGLDLEKYEEANMLSDAIKVEKKRYVLLKTELWLNSILLKEKCGAKFDTLVYLYSSDPSNTLLVSEQKMFSNVLKEIKEDYGNRVILLPIAGDLDLNIVNLQLRLYNVSAFPTLIINEDVLLEGFQTYEQIEGYLDSFGVIKLN